MNYTENFKQDDMIDDIFPVKLDGFEGPLDLLLYLIKNQEIDIYDIPIAIVTKQYLEYVEMMKLLNLEIAGEYLLMAATLIRIKTRLLMPKHQDVEGEEEDPREELIVALLEYKRFKEAAEKMRRLEIEERQKLTHQDFSYLKPEIVENLKIDATLYDLLRAFSEIMEQSADQPHHEVDNFDLSIEDQVEYVLQELEISSELTLSDLVEKNQIKLYYVVTFLALLELMKLQRINIKQYSIFGEIHVRKI